MLRNSNTNIILCMFYFLFGFGSVFLREINNMKLSGCHGGRKILEELGERKNMIKLYGMKNCLKV